MLLVSISHFATFKTSIGQSSSMRDFNTTAKKKDTFDIYSTFEKYETAKKPRERSMSKMSTSCAKIKPPSIDLCEENLLKGMVVFQLSHFYNKNILR